MKKHSHSVTYSIICASLLLASSSAAARASALPALAIGPQIGTTGIGVQITTPLWPNYLNLTTGYSGFGLGIHATSDGQPYQVHLRLGGAPVYLSAYPFGRHFHIDAGIFINQNRISLNARPSNGTYVFNGQTYTETTLGTVTGETHFNRVAPYFGIGWGNPFFGSRWTFMANAGVILEGGAEAHIQAQNEDAVPGARQNIEASQQDFDDKIGFLKAFPVVNLGLDYRF